VITVFVENDIDDDLKLSHKTIEALCESVLINEGHDSAEVTFIFTDDESLRALKKQFFDMDVYTDVITFNLEDEGEPLEGEIYISWDRVKDNAQTLRVDVDEELKRMVVHSSLHLVGYEDKTSDTKDEMTQLEEKYISLNSEGLIQ
jgi:probable rRNA maturation factor